MIVTGGGGIFRTGDERNMSFSVSFSVCPRTRVVPYGWHRFWLMHAYFIYVQIALVRQKQKIIPDIYNNLDKWDIYVRGSKGAYMYLQQGSLVLRIPQRMYSSLAYHITYLEYFSTLWMPDTCILNIWNIHFLIKKIINPQWYMVRTGTSSERYNTFSNIPRSENAPLTLAYRFHWYKFYDISGMSF